MNSFDKIIPVQTVRLIDVFVIAPFLIYAGKSAKNNYIKYGLIGIGVLTALYNGVHYIENKKNGK
jgi:hypothetical protein